MDKNEYKFPDEIDETKASAQEDGDEDEFVVEIEDDTPEEDRGKEPLPKDIINSLETPEEGGEYPEEVVSKFKQYKKAWHDERREKEKAYREQEEALRIAQGILEENKRLKATLSSGEQEYIATVKAAAETEVEVAKRNYREAYDSGDAEKLVDAQQALMDASLKLDRTRNFKPTLQDEETEVQLPQRSQADNKPQPVDPKFADWQRRNSNWFQKDEEMTDAAMGLHKKLYREYGQEYIGTDEYYERIDKTIRKRFPEAFNDTSEPQKPQKSKPSTVVASARRSTAPKQVKLTSTQAALAKKFKLTPEQYAREVLKLQEN
jgi:hypothetical protein